DHGAHPGGRRRQLGDDRRDNVIGFELTVATPLQYAPYEILDKPVSQSRRGSAYRRLGKHMVGARYPAPRIVHCNLPPVRGAGWPALGDRWRRRTGIEPA